MKIQSDEQLNSELQKEVSEIRSSMISQVKKEESERFIAKPSNMSPSTIITDTITGRCVEVPLFASREVLVALNKFFESDTLFDALLLEVDKALNHYDSENVDVILNEETELLYVAYHSDNNSFPISLGICKKDDVNLEKLIEELDKRSVGHCW